MNYRALGRTGWQVSEISLGAWAIGGSWGAGFDGDLAYFGCSKAREAGRVGIVEAYDQPVAARRELSRQAQLVVILDDLPAQPGVGGAAALLGHMIVLRHDLAVLVEQVDETGV